MTFLLNCDDPYMLEIHYAMFLGETSEILAWAFRLYFYETLPCYTDGFAAVQSMHNTSFTMWEKAKKRTSSGEISSAA
jgi:hypothetical protein